MTPELARLEEADATYRRARTERLEAALAALNAGLPIRQLDRFVPSRTLRRLRDGLPVYGSAVQPRCNLPNARRP